LRDVMKRITDRLPHLGHQRGRVRPLRHGLPMRADPGRHRRQRRALPAGQLHRRVPAAAGPERRVRPVRQLLGDGDGSCHRSREVTGEGRVGWWDEGKGQG
jgi:hypothetical protein